jgi:hypothetical protein
VADICKHDWFFVNGTDDLKCKRCGEVTGPRTYEERIQDILEYDTTQFYMPTGQLQIAEFKPDYNISFHRVVDGRNGDVVGKLDFNGPELVFTGDADESAQVFIDWIANAFHGRLEQERKSELDACCDLLEGMHAATDGNHNYYLHAANELRKLRNIK